MPDFFPRFSVNVPIQLGEKYQESRITRVGSLLPASPPLWITKDGKDYYVSGAQVMMRNLMAESSDGRKQYLHIINRVLEPIKPLEADDSVAFVGLTAGKLLRKASEYDIDGHALGYGRTDGRTDGRCQHALMHA